MDTDTATSTPAAPTEVGANVTLRQRAGRQDPHMRFRAFRLHVTFLQDLGDGWWTIGGQRLNGEWDAMRVHASQVHPA